MKAVLGSFQCSEKWRLPRPFGKLNTVIAADDGSLSGEPSFICNYFSREAALRRKLIMLDTLFELNLDLTEDVQYAANGSLGSQFIKALADTYTVQFFSQVAHWNVMGPDFPQLHELYSESYELCSKAVDDVAEQARILGIFIPKSLSALLAASNIDFAVEGNAPGEYSAQLTACHQSLKTTWDKITAVCGTDAGAADLASSLSAKHAKMAWKLRSTIESQE